VDRSEAVALLEPEVLIFRADLIPRTPDLGCPQNRHNRAYRPKHPYDSDNENFSIKIVTEVLTLRCMKCDAQITPNGDTNNARFVADCLHCDAVNLLVESRDHPGTYYVAGVSVAAKRSR